MTLGLVLCRPLSTTRTFVSSTALWKRDYAALNSSPCSTRLNRYANCRGGGTKQHKVNVWARVGGAKSSRVGRVA